MRWLGDRESENVEDRRGMGGGFPVGISGGIGAIVVLIVGLFLGIDPSTLMAVLNGGAPDAQTNDRQVDQPGYGSSRLPDTRTAGGEDRMRQFVSVVLADTEDVWRQAFRDLGRTYRDPKLVLYSDVVQSPCGMASSATGPFYCPNDQKVYLDTAFFDDMKRKMHASGEFAQAYVIAHEIGHHVQNELGILKQAQAARARGDQRTSNAISVRTELQADCLAGVWANHADRTKHILEQGDVEAAINAAAAVGDDRLQRQARGTVVPDAFTHGSSAQRVAWFRRGIESGELKSCDTFASAQP
jgi:predicted metalloprotease